ncbi:MAG: endolytic transglycosylase MltG [Candidatus Paceibacterota bacterium]
MNESTVQNELPKSKPNYRWVYFLLVILAALSAFYLFMFRAPDDFKINEIFSVEEGYSLRKISFKLKEADFIRSRVAFETFVILLGGEKNLAVGDYIFPHKIHVLDVARKISTGDRELGMVKITIPEGFDNYEIAEVADLKLRDFDKNRFLSLASSEIGYLFPDTYFFSTTDDESTVIQLMSRNFKKKTSSIFDEITASGQDSRDVIIMASILEEEANGDEDRALISGILWKRMKIGMPLQVDAVPITYKEMGLPKAPVSNPGLLAIKAAWKPQESKYLYYIHDKEGKIYFAKNFDEHRQNIRKYLR